MTIVRLLVTALLIGSSASVVRAAGIPPLQYEEQTLENGLHVIYAPMRHAPVVHVRLLYHVGSRDERPDRQGFAHMFEHMMFRGSRHVASEQHMKLINDTGGDSNAFTSFDQTTYVNTVPANHLELALWLEADRLASFKVNADVFSTERNVVAEEWRMRTANPPYGTMFQDFMRTAFQAHSYRWTPIGDMDQLRQASVAELQEFWNTYYVPNNACLVIAGDFDVSAARAMVQRYYAWIPRGPAVDRGIPQEPRLDEPRRFDEHRRNVPLTSIMVGFRTADYASEDHVPLEALAGILGGGRSSRLSRLLVTGDKPLCQQASANSWRLQDHGMFLLQAAVLPGRDADEVETIMRDALRGVVENGVTAEELEKVRTLARIQVIRGRETASSVAGELGEARLFGGDAALANRDVERLERLTLDDIRRVAQAYLATPNAVTVRYLPDPLGQNSKPLADRSAGMKEAPVADDGRQVEPRPVAFPEGYRATPPTDANTISVRFAKGDAFDVEGLKVIVVPDARLPLVSWTLVLRGGGDAEPAGLEGLADAAASMMRRGAADLGFQALNEDLESRGINLEVSDGGDVTRVSGSALVDQLDHAFLRMRQVLAEPTFPEDEFAKLRQQRLAGLRQALSNPSAVAGREMNIALWGDAPAGRVQSFASIAAVTLDQVKRWRQTVVRRDGALLVFSGDIDVERARALAASIVSALPEGPAPKADYALSPLPPGRRIILVDNPDGRQANIRMAVRGFTLASDEKYAGNIVSRILSEGIESRLNRYVRAEKGLSYGVTGVFQPGRHVGSFLGSTDTNPQTVAASIEAMWKVFSDLRASEVTPAELSEARGRVIGGMALQMQTIDQQAGRRVDIELNGYPLDYYDVYPSKIAAVTAPQVQKVMKDYVDDGRMTIVVVGPAEAIKPQLEPLGAVEVIPMPLKRQDAAAAAEPGMIKPAS